VNTNLVSAQLDSLGSELMDAVSNLNPQITDRNVGETGSGYLTINVGNFLLRIVIDRGEKMLEIAISRPYPNWFDFDLVVELVNGTKWFFPKSMSEKFKFLKEKSRLISDQIIHEPDRFEASLAELSNARGLSLFNSAASKQ
jgi:hypothetical protein